MLSWIVRGLRRGSVTTGFPKVPEPAPDGFRGPLAVIDPFGADPLLEAVCPTGAISVDAGMLRVDRGRCIQCGLCVEANPERFRFLDRYETASRRRSALVVGADNAVHETLRPTLADRARPLRRSIHIRHVDAGSDGSEEWEIQALTNPYYDMQRLGLYFTLAPRHADVLLVTGGVTPSMREPLLRTYEVMPHPKAVVAAGTDACSGGLAEGGGEVAGGVDRLLEVDVYVPGSPPSPIALLHGLLLAAGIVAEEEEEEEEE